MRMYKVIGKRSARDDSEPFCAEHVDTRIPEQLRLILAFGVITPRHLTCKNHKYKLFR